VRLLLSDAIMGRTAMNRFVLASLALLPAIPASVHLVRAVRVRSGGRARSVILWGALTIAAGAAVYGVVAVLAFPAVAAAEPEDKATVLSLGLARGSPALFSGLLVGALFCILGGVMRSVSNREAGRS
jgi:hypothetical protein